MPKAALSYFGHVRMNEARRRGRPRQRWLDTLKGYSSGATISNMRQTPEIERDGEELPRLSPGVGYDSTAEGIKVSRLSKSHSYNKNETAKHVKLCSQFMEITG